MVGYGWVDTLEAYCFTVVVGLDPDDAIRRLGGDPERPESARTFDECFWPADGPQWAQVGRIRREPARETPHRPDGSPTATPNGGLLVAEHNGWRAEEEVEQLSRGARIACFFRNVEAVMHFVYAVNGRILAEFDPLLDRGPRAGADPHSVAVALQGLPFGLFAAERSAFTLLERLTGVRIEEEWLATPQRSVSLPPLSAVLPAQ